MQRLGTLRIVPETSRFLRVLLVGAILAIAFWWRWQFLHVPLERDEGEYAYFGQLLRDGGVPYVDAHHMKLPGVYFVYAGVFSIFPDSALTVRLVATGAHLLAAGFLYALARHWLSPTAAILATATFAVLGSGPGILGFAAKAEQFVLALALPGLWLALQADRRARSWLLVPAGILLGLAYLMKQSAVVFLVPAFLFFSAQTLPRFAARAAILVGSYLLPLAGLAALLCWWDAWQPFWFWTFVYAREYASGVGWSEGLAQLGRSARHLLHDAPALWLAAVAGAGARILSRPISGGVPFWGFVLASLGSVALGWRFSEHYFLLLVPAASLLAATWAEARFTRHALFGAAFLASAAGTALWREWTSIRELTPEQKARLVYQANPFPEALEVGRFLRAHSRPEDRIAVLGSEPQIYFYAQRRAATGYLYMYPLMETHPYARNMQRDLIEELERRKPRFAVLVHVPSSWRVRADSDRTIFTWSAEWVNRDYRMVGLIRMEANGPSWMYWGEEAAQAPRGDTYLAVFERRP